MGEVYSTIGEELSMNETLREQQGCFHRPQGPEAYCRINPVDQINRPSLHPIDSSLCNSSASSHLSSSHQHPAFMDYQVAPVPSSMPILSIKEKSLAVNKSSSDADPSHADASNVSTTSTFPATQVNLAPTSCDFKTDEAYPLWKRRRFLPPKEAMHNTESVECMSEVTCHARSEEHQMEQRKKLSKLQKMIKRSKKRCHRLEQQKIHLIDQMTCQKMSSLKRKEKRSPRPSSYKSRHFHKVQPLLIFGGKASKWNSLRTRKIRQLLKTLRKKTFLSLTPRQLRKAVHRKRQMKRQLKQEESPRLLDAILIRDPKSQYLKEQSALDQWSDEEKNCFCEKFACYGKYFHSIAEHLPKKSVGDCVQFYYLTKKNISYKELTRIQTRRSTAAAAVASAFLTTTASNVLKTKSSSSSSSSSSVDSPPDLCRKSKSTEKFSQTTQKVKLIGIQKDKFKLSNVTKVENIAREKPLPPRSPLELIASLSALGAVSTRSDIKPGRQFINNLYSPCIKDIIHSVIDSALSTDYSDTISKEVKDVAKEDLNAGKKLSSNNRKSVVNAYDISSSSSSSSAFVQPKQNEIPLTTKVSSSIRVVQSHQISKDHTNKSHSILSPPQNSSQSLPFHPGATLPSQACQSSMQVKSEHSIIHPFSHNVNNGNNTDCKLQTTSPNLLKPIPVFPIALDRQHLPDQFSTLNPSQSLNTALAYNYFKYDPAMSQRAVQTNVQPIFSRQLAMPSYPLKINKDAPSPQSSSPMQRIWISPSNEGFIGSVSDNKSSSLSTNSSRNVTMIPSLKIDSRGDAYQQHKQQLQQASKFHHMWSTSVMPVSLPISESLKPQFTPSSIQLNRNGDSSVSKHNVVEFPNLLDNNRSSDSNRNYNVSNLLSKTSSSTSGNLDASLSNSNNSINVRASDLLEAIIHKHIGETSQCPSSDVGTATIQKVSSNANLSSSSSSPPKTPTWNMMDNVGFHAIASPPTGSVGGKSPVVAMSPSLPNKMIATPKISTKSAPLLCTMRGCIDKFIEDLVQTPTPPTTPDLKDSSPTLIAKKRGRPFSQLSTPSNNQTTSGPNPPADRVVRSLSSHVKMESSFNTISSVQSTKDFHSNVSTPSPSISFNFLSAGSSSTFSDATFSGWRSTTHTPPRKDMSVPLKKRPLPPQFRFDS